MCVVEMAIFNIQRAITLKVGKQELQFICSACHLKVFNTHTEKTKTIYFVFQGYSQGK